MQHLASRIRQERRRLGWNQTQLAHHLKTTKTTISKWETGQLLPDITQLPILARLFNTSVDEMLNVTSKHSREETKAIISDLIDKLSHSKEDFVSTIEAYFQQSSNDYEFLVALLGVMSTNIQRLKQDALRDKAIALAFEIVHIIETNCTSTSLLRKTYGYKVTFWYVNGEFDQIIEHLSDYEVNLGENLLLGSAYLAQDDREKATSIIQSDMYQNLNLMVQEFVLLVAHELPHLSVEELAPKYEYLNLAFNIDQLFPFLAMQIYYYFAEYYVEIDDTKAQHFLEHYTTCYERLVIDFSFQTDAFFDAVEPWFEHFPAGQSLSLDFDETVEQYMNIIIDSPKFQKLSNYEEIVSQLKQVYRKSM
ncbi:helix-turn-helix domain-containing protein [Staphylococcus argensis]|uniref:helix-turn-helix domain-containing protein n=1 Tax=Staphylococcus argensis TaxID=1607738 RepID=UPI00142DC747|nr:helix-turn-helix transcriptional regulator [Staphylococcus argensis]MCY6991952.1 helix-turn-helix domain-containing protein [Staphylococcus argensis]